MRKLLIMLMIMAGAAVYAQKGGNPSMQTIDISQVPDSVKNAQGKAFAGITVTRWEMHSGKKGSQYIAEFVDQNSLRSRARCDVAGKTLSTTKFYGPDHLPPVIVTASKRYAGFRVTMAEEIFSAKKNKSWFSVRMRSASARMTVLLDESGNEVTPDKVPEEVQPEPSSPSNN
jgi:hypothetical protein